MQERSDSIKLGYRPDIDGLRAIAVLAVILYHYGIGPFKGGFVGVDIFFVISGFLITSIIYLDVNAGDFSIAKFYDRRFRRILPALLLVLVVFLLLGYALLIPIDFKNLGAQSGYASFGLSNFYFWNHSGYFDVGADQQPMLHTWSLGVEEQFYVVWPLALYGLLKLGRQRAVIGTLMAVIVISLALAAYQVAQQPISAFYLLPSRAWELALGALLVFLPRLPRVAGQIAPAVGLALIVYAIFTLTSASPFPGLNALCPCLGAAFIIWPRTAESYSVLPLRFPPMVWTGLISYSLYLWHWPVLVFYKLMGIGAPLTQIEVWSLLAVTVVLSIASYVVIERPFRRRKANRIKVIMTGVLAMAVAAAAGTSVWAMDGMMSRYSPKAQSYLRLLENDAIANGSDERCFLNSTEPIAGYIKDVCIQHATDKPNVLVLGESFAAQYQKPLQAVFPEISFSIATAAGCQPVLPLYGKPNCVNFDTMVFNDFIPGFHYDAILLSANWTLLSISKLPGTLKMLKSHTDHVVIFGPTQLYSAWLPGLLVKSETLHDNGRIINQASKLKQQRELEVQMRGHMTDDGEFYSILSTICPEKENGCRLLTDDGIPVNIDYGHFSVPAAKMVLSKLRQEGLFAPLLHR